MYALEHTAAEAPALLPLQGMPVVGGLKSTRTATGARCLTALLAPRSAFPCSPSAWLPPQACYAWFLKHSGARVDKKRVVVGGNSRAG